MTRILFPLLLIAPLAAQIPGSEHFTRELDFFAVEQYFATQPWDASYQATLDAVFDAGLQLPQFAFAKTGSGEAGDPNVVFATLRSDPIWRTAGVRFEDFMAAMCTAGTAWERADHEDELLAGLDDDLADLAAALELLRDRPRLQAQAAELHASLSALRDSLSARSSVSDAPPKDWAPPVQEQAQEELSMFEFMKRRMKRRMRKMREARRKLHEAIFNP